MQYMNIEQNNKWEVLISFLKGKKEKKHQGEKKNDHVRALPTFKIIQYTNVREETKDSVRACLCVELSPLPAFKYSIPNRGQIVSGQYLVSKMCLIRNFHL